MIPSPLALIEPSIKETCSNMLENSIASYTYGWPAARIGPNSVTIPQIIDDEYLLEEGEGIQPIHKPSRLAFFYYYIKMCEAPREISDSILLFGQNPAEQGITTPLTQYISSMPKHCVKVDELLANLPSYLQEANEQTVDECFRVQGLVLRTRYVRSHVKPHQV